MTWAARGSRIDTRDARVTFPATVSECLENPQCHVILPADQLDQSVLLGTQSKLVRVLLDLGGDLAVL
jgi:hypothetical protein